MVDFRINNAQVYNFEPIRAVNFSDPSKESANQKVNEKENEYNSVSSDGDTLELSKNSANIKISDKLKEDEEKTAFEETIEKITDPSEVDETEKLEEEANKTMKEMVEEELEEIREYNFEPQILSLAGYTRTQVELMYRRDEISYNDVENNERYRIQIEDQRRVEEEGRLWDYQLLA